MSSEYYRRQVTSLHKDVADLQKQKASAASDRAKIQARIAAAYSSMSSNRSASNVQSRSRDIERLTSDISREESKIAGYEGKIAQKQNDLHRAQGSLAKEEESEARKLVEADKRRDAESKKREDERKKQEDKRKRDEQRHQQEQQRRERQTADRHAREMSDVTSRLRAQEDLHRQTMDTLEKLQQLPEQIVTLFVAANPVNEKPLQLDEEIRLIEEKIRLSKHRDAVKLVAKWAVRLPDLFQALNEHEPHIVHFSGHGSDQDEIIFLDSIGNAKPVTKDAIVQLMSALAGNIRVVVFNTCYSHAQAEAVVKHIDVAIGMNDSIGDEAARIFSSQFYSAIGFGKSVKNAFDQAKALLHAEGMDDAALPELFVRDGIEADQIVLVRPPA